MVWGMDSGLSEEGRAAAPEGPSGAVSAHTVPLSGGSGSARQSPKFCTTPASTTAPAASTGQLILQRNSLSPSVPRKIMSKNHNNTSTAKCNDNCGINNSTVFPTSYPTNLAELQLYRVMQYASLLLYYDTLLEMGGDDVQQLCDAGEEEFLEIMSLVGMASKPLHVRRLQKSLQEWVTNPAKFKLPLVPGEDFELELSSPRITSNHGFYAGESDANRAMYSSSPGDVSALPPVSSPGLSLNKRPYSPMDPACAPCSSSVQGSVQLTPTLMESQIQKLAAAAERLSKQLPQFEPKPQNTKKKVCKELELVMSMLENDPRRMDEIRRYAAIYGRFDCKRKPEKPLTLHEVSVNEAAAQICRFIPALLTRRDELFPLARQVVKDSGCYYSKTQLSSVYMSKSGLNDREESGVRSGSPRIHLDNDGVIVKKPKVEPSSDSDEQRQDCFDDSVIVRTSIHTLFQQNTSKNHSREIRRSSIGGDLEDSEHHYYFSNSSSPKDQELGSQSFSNDAEDGRGDEEDAKFSPKVQIIAASGDNIIAVANPALAMSTAIIPPLLDSREGRSDKE